VQYATRQSNGTWNVETVAALAGVCTGGITTGFSLELDSTGAPRVAFGAAEGLVLATKTGSSWPTELVDAAGAVGSLAIAKDGTPHLCYGRANAMWHATKRGGKWVQEVVQDVTEGDASLGGYYGGASAVVDSAGHVHVVYYDWHWFGNFTYQGRYATNASGKWKSGAMSVAAGFRVVWTSLAIDAADKLYVATDSFPDYGGGGTSYGSSPSTTGAVADSVVTGISNPSVAVAPDGTPRLFGSSDVYPNPPLVHLSPAAGSSWTSAVVDGPAFIRNSVAVAYDTSNRPNVTSDDVPGEVWRKEGASWVKSVYAADAKLGALVMPGVTADLHAAYMRNQ